MKNEFQAVVIGGGVVGASVLYHLTKAGWKDVVLLERRELTAGSTWHAAGGMHTLNGDPNVARLQQYTINLYEEIEKVSGQSCSIHLCGGLMLADTEDRMDFLRMAVARGRYLGMELEMITPNEARDIFPVMDPKYFVGALYDRDRGPRRSDRRHPGLREVRPDGRRGGPPAHAGHGPVAASGRDLGRPDRGRRPDPRRARRQRRGPVGARGRPDGGSRAPGPRHGAPVRPHRRRAGDQGVQRVDRQRAADDDRLRRRDLRPPGRRRDAPGHVRAGRQAVVARWRRPGTSGRSSSSRTWTGSRPRCRSPRSTSRRWRRSGSSRSSTARSRSRRTAIRWSARSAGCATTGSPAG